MHLYGFPSYSSALLASHLNLSIEKASHQKSPLQNKHIKETWFPIYTPDRTSLMLNLITYSPYASNVKVFLYGLYPSFEKEGISPDLSYSKRH